MLLDHQQSKSWVKGFRNAITALDSRDILVQFFISSLLRQAVDMT